MLEEGGYWDKESGRLYELAFMPNVVKCKQKWVQQMASLVNP